MLARVLTRLSYANVVASLALFVALGGSAFAAVQLSKGQVKTRHLAKSAVKAKKLAPNAVTSGKVRNGSLRAKDFRTGELVAGASGAQGPKGDTGATGATGPFPDGNLPGGKTLRGEYASYGQRDAGSAASLAASAISFGFTLASAPVPHYLESGETDANCPGTADDPQARAGHLCVYEYGRYGTVKEPYVASGNVSPRASRWGASVEVEANADGHYGIRGRWAVTTP